MAFDMSGWLDDDSWQITGVKSEKHESGSYSIPCPSIHDTALLRRIMQRYERINAASEALKQAVEAEDDTATKEHSETLATLAEESNADVQAYVGTALDNLDDAQEAMHRKLFGPAYDEMVEDGVSSVRMDRLYQAAVLRFTQGEEVVARIVELEGKALALGNRADRRAAAKPAKKAAPRSSARKATSRSSRASSGTKARTASRASTRSSKTSGTAAPRAKTA